MSNVGHIPIEANGWIWRESRKGRRLGMTYLSPLHVIGPYRDILFHSLASLASLASSSYILFRNYLVSYFSHM